IRTDGVILTVTDHRELHIRNTHRGQKFLRGTSPLIAQRDIIFLRAALIGVTLDHQFLAGITGQDAANNANVVLEYRGRVGPNGSFVVVKQRVLQPGEAVIERRALLRGHSRRACRLRRLARRHTHRSRSGRSPRSGRWRSRYHWGWRGWPGSHWNGF